MTYPRFLLAFAVLGPLALLLAPAGALAYCRTSTCKECPRDPETGCTMGGKPIAWPSACATFSMHEDASQQVELEVASEMMEEAFARWEAVRCPPDGKPPSIHVRRVDNVMCGANEYRSEQGNANVVLFRDDAWPYANEEQTLAVTNVKYHPETGEIYDADLEVNGTKTLLVEEHYAFTKAYVPGAADLLSIMVHEAGHFLGLDHSKEPDAIMKVALDPGETHIDLSPDDEAAICAVYPPERDAEPCPSAAEQPFSAQCALDPTHGGACTVGAGPGAREVPVGLWLASCLAMLAYMGGRRVRM